MTIIGEAFVTVSATDEVTPALEEAGKAIESNIGEAGEENAGRFKAAMSTIGSTVVTALGPAFQPVEGIMKQIGQIGETAAGMSGKVGKTFVAAGGATTILGSSLTMLGDKGKVSMGQLQLAVEAAGGNWDEYQGKTNDAIKSQQHFGFSSSDTTKALATLVTKTGDVSGSYAQLGLLTDVAANKGTSLSSASGVVAKVMTGNTKVLKAYGISTSAVAQASETAALKETRATAIKLRGTIATDKAKLAALDEADAKIKSQLASGKEGGAREKLAAVMRTERVAALQAQLATIGQLSPKEKLAKAMREERVASLRAQLASTKDKGEREKLKAAIDKERVSKVDVAKASAKDEAARAKLRAEIQKEKDAKTDSIVGNIKESEASDALKAKLEKNKDTRAKLTAKIKENERTQKELNKELKDGASKTEKGAAAAQILADKLKGSAALGADTFTGKMKEAKVKVQDFVMQAGEKVGPVLQKLGPAFMGVGALMESGIIGKTRDFIKNSGGMIAAVGKVTGITKIWTGVQWLLNAAMSANPIGLIIAAIVALGAAFVIAYVKIKPFREFIDSIARSIAKFFTAAVDKVKQTFHEFVAAFKEQWTAIQNVLKKAWAGMRVVFRAIMAIPSAIVRAWNGIIGFFSRLFSSIGKTVAAFVSRVVQFFRDLWTKVRTTVSTMISGVITFFRELPGRIVSALSSLGRTVSGAISRAFSGIKGLVTGFFKGAGEWVSNAGKQVINGFVGGAKAVWNTIAGLLGKINGAVQAAVTGTRTWLSQKGKDVINGLVSGIGSVWSTISGKVSGIGTAVKNSITGAASWLVQTGSDIISGLLSGMGDIAGKVWSKLSAGLSGMVGKAKSLLGIGSPSKVFANEVGGPITQGIVAGLQGQIPKLQTALNGVRGMVEKPKISFGGITSGGTLSAAGGLATVNGTKIINLFPDASIDFADQDPAAVVQRLQNAIVASRL